MLSLFDLLVANKIVGHGDGSGSGSGSGSDTLFGKEVISGSITLEEDATSKVTLLENIDKVFGNTNLHAFCFREKSSRDNSEGLWASSYQTIYYNNGKNQTAGNSAFYISNGNTTAGKNLGINVNKFDETLIINFSSSCKGYAGDTYRWFAFSAD